LTDAVYLVASTSGDRETFAGITVKPDGRVLFNLLVEYVPGGDLAEIVKRQGGLDESTIVLYTRGVLNGLVYLHGTSIDHCDVKGNNVLVGQDEDVVKLANLGYATWMDDGCQGQGIMSGTPLYMALEVARGEE
ncbi:hypothetical protein Taro_055618, partial [Colocasia esculenta]|nr:hypothetical protein [Colocasia esculenta]